MKYTDIKMLTRSAQYRINVPWKYLETLLKEYDERKIKGDLGLNLNPDFQRAHVWDLDKQIKYVEFILRGGDSSKEIHFNHPNFQGSFVGEMTLVDGKQRIEAVRKFLGDRLSVFNGIYYKDFEGRTPPYAEFIFHINNLKTRKEMLQWYIDLNDGGVPHTTKEILKVKKLLEKEN